MIFRISILLFFLMPLQAFASNNVAELSLSDDEYTLGPFVEFIEDAGLEFSISDFSSTQREFPFKTSTTQIFGRGLNHAPYWVKVKFQIHSPRRESVQRYLEIKHPGPGLRDMLFYYAKLDADGVNIEAAQQILKKDFLPANSLLIPLALETNSTYVMFVRGRSNTYLKIPLSLWSPRAYYKNQLLNDVVHGAVCGILVAVLMYYIFSFIQIRKPLLLYGGLLTFSILLLVMSIHGSFYQYIVFGSAKGEEVLSLSIGVLMPAAGIAFVREFLCTAKNCVIEDKVLLAMLPLLAVAAVCLVFDAPGLMMFVVIPTVAIWIVLSIWMGIRCWLKGYKEARFFLLGWAIFFLSVFSRLLEILNVLPSNLYIDLAMSFSPAITAVTFSMALSDRMNLSISERSMLHRSTVTAMKQSDQIKDEFLTKISHELRTPMNGVLGALHILRTRPNDKEFGENIFAATMASRSMIGTVNNLLDYTEASSGKMRLSTQTFNHNQFIKKICEDFDNSCDLKGLEFNLNSNLTDNLYLDGDEEKLEHMLSQIVGNGVKFCSQGAVTLSVNEYSVEDGSKVGLQYRIEDTGIGIDESMKARLFDYFSQADNSITRSYEGLGMGLSVARCILKLMKGDMSINNLPQGGAVVEIKVVFKRSIQAEIIEIERLDTIYSRNDECFDSELFRETPILIVEDNKVNQMVLRGLLKKLGYKTLIAENGKVAVELLSQENVLAILMDIQMPVMDGYEATRVIRASGTANAHVPIIAVTANALSEDRENCLRAGMDDYIKKPVDVELIKRKLKIWLHKKVS